MSPQDRRTATALYLLGELPRTQQVSAEAGAFLRFAIAELVERTEAGPLAVRVLSETELAGFFRYALPETGELSPAAGAALSGAIASLGDG